MTTMICIATLMMLHLLCDVNGEVAWSPQPAELIGATTTWSGSGVQSTASNMFDGPPTEATWGFGAFNAILCPDDEYWWYATTRPDHAPKKNPTSAFVEIVMSGIK
jgi:hypothetical protein